MISEEKLGPDQREVINDLSKDWKNTWIKGHAGSGKSVLLIHLLRDYLAKHPRANVCVVVFTNSLVDMLAVGIKELNLEKRFNTTIPVMTIYKFNGSVTHYDVVFCDEVQDLPVSFLVELKSRSNQVIVAGDEAQSIYTNVPVFDEPPASPGQITGTLNAQQKPLHYIYRMTKSVVALLSKVFTTLLNGRPNVEKNDVEIKYCKAGSLKKEIDYIWKEATKINQLRSDEIVAVLLPHIDNVIEFSNLVLNQNGASEWIIAKNGYGKHDFGNLNSYLRTKNIPLMYVGQKYGSLEDADRENKIILMTYNSSKGLDFDHVFLPMLGTAIHLPAEKSETLCFVALSRSKYNLIISYSGDLYPPMQKFMHGKTPFEIENMATAKGGIII